MTPTHEYRVVLQVGPQVGPLTPTTFPDRTAAEAYRENLRSIVRNASRVQYRVPDGTWVDISEPEGS